jgi:DNA-binding transcriptional LysR family regulator
VASQPDLNPRVLRYFVTLAEAGTYTRAAELLHLSTPSLSQQIGKLERDLGIQLVERDHRGARLTEAGAEFLDEATKILAAHDHAIGAVRRHVRARQRQIRIGFLATVAGPRTHAILAALRNRLPDIKTDLVQVTWAEQVTAVATGVVDVVFARPPLDPGRLATYPVFSEGRVVAMAADHRLAQKSQLSVDDLSGVVHADTDSASDEWRRWWSVDPRPDGTPVIYGPMVHGIEETLEIVANTDAIVVTAESVATTYPRRDIAYRPLTGVEPARIVLVAPTIQSEAVRALITAITQTA